MIARTHQFAIVLGAIKDEPSRAREVRVLDRPCARRHDSIVAGTEEWAPPGPNQRMDLKEVDQRPSRDLCRT